MERDEAREVKEFCRVRAIGQKELIRYLLTEEKLGRTEAILAQCYQCCGGYAAGKYSCKTPSCPLYPYMPYKDHHFPEVKE